jgi:2'-5' RNA ligase
MDFTVPGKSLDAQFDKLWTRFKRLRYTTDSINSWQARWQRWLTPINVSIIVPIEDEAVCQYIIAAQEALRPFMSYAPQPHDKLHITVYQVGYLRTGLALPGTWTREALGRIQSQAGRNLRLIEPFNVQVGPFNAFPNVAIAEVHDEGKLRLLRAVVARAMPPLSRPLPTLPLIPHVTLGYFGLRPAGPIHQAMLPLRRVPPVVMRVDRLDMTLYYRKPGPHDPSRALVHSTEEVIATLRLGN